MNIAHMVLMVLVSWSFATAAATPPVALLAGAQCPAVGEEYTAMIGKLEAIKASVRKSANCNNVALKVKDLEQLLVTDRQKIKEIIESGRQAPLSAQQSEAVRDYAEQITVKVTSLYDLFTNSNHCFSDDDKESRVTALAGFVGEASRLVASLSGPWGTPIAMAGHVAAGFLTGMDKVLKSRVGHDFTKPASWTNYVQNLCTFYSYREQIEHLLNPQGRIAELNGIKNLLELNIQKMSNSCGDCATVEPMATYMAYNLGIRAWAIKEIARVEKESASFWSDVSGRHLLSQVRDDLQNFLVDREGPRFVSHQAALAASQVKALHFRSDAEGRDLYNQIYRANPQAVTGDLRYYFSGFMEFFRALVTKPVLWEKLPANPETEDLHWAWKSYRDRNLTRFRSTEATVQVTQGFCQFFRQAGLYSPQIRSACTSYQAKNSAEAVAGLAKELVAANVLPGSVINPLVFDPAGNLPRGPQTRMDSLNHFVQQLAPR